MDPMGARSKEVFLAGMHPKVMESFCQSAELSLKEFFCLRRGHEMGKGREESWSLEKKRRGGKLGRARRCELGLAEHRAVCHPAAPRVPHDPQ